MMKEFVHQFCLAAKNAGIEKLNFYMEERRKRDVSVYDGKLEYLERSEMSQLFIEGLVDDRSGCVFIENFDEQLIPDYIQSIRDTAAISTAPFVPYDLKNLKQEPTIWYEFTTLADAVQAMCDGCCTAQAVDSRIAPGIQVHLSETGRRVTLADEQENYATDVNVGGKVGFHLVARDGELVQPGGKGKPFNIAKLPNLNELAPQAPAPPAIIP